MCSDTTYTNDADIERATEPDDLLTREVGVADLARVAALVDAMPSTTYLLRAIAKHLRSNYGSEQADELEAAAVAFSTIERGVL